MKKVTKKEIFSQLNDYLINWKHMKKSRFKNLDERTFHLYYPKNKLKVINDYSYEGEKINKKDLKRIDMFCCSDNIQWVKKK